MAAANIFRALWITALGLLSLATILGARNMASDRQYTDFNFDSGEGRKSVHDVRVLVPSKEWEAYFTQMRDFAKANDFKIRIERLKPGFDVFFVDVWRSNVLLLVATPSTLPSFIF